MGYVKNQRKGSTGIGFTFEQLMGVIENNIPIPDLGGRIEIKTTRRDSNSLLTLFTFNKGAWIEKQKNVIEFYGYNDQDGKKALKRTLKFNSTGDLILSINEQNHSVSLVDKKLNKILATWSLYAIVGKFSTKLDRVLYVIADRKINVNGDEEFWYNEAYMLSEPLVDNFIHAFKNSKVAIDLRMHLKENGIVRNRGTAFRVYEKNFPSLFNKKDRIL